MAGSTGRKRWGQNAQAVMAGGPTWLLLGLVSAIALPVIGEMIFGLLGVTPEDPNWRFVLLLGGLWVGVAARFPVEWQRATGKWPRGLGWMLWLGRGDWGRGAHGKLAGSPSSQRSANAVVWVSRMAAGALLGFFYGGRWTGNEVRGAIAGLLLGLVLALYVGLGLARTRPGLERAMGMAIALCAAYGLWFWLGAWGLAALMARHWLPGLLYSWAALSFCQWTGLGLRWFGAYHRWQDA